MPTTKGGSDEQRGSAVDQCGSDVLTGTIGARRAWTVSMISALSFCP
jgi:hypothetical protein